MANQSQYDASNINVLKGLEAVRKRPGMYIGDISSVAATHHMLYEIFDNGIDEALGGHADLIEVCLHNDGSASVRDNGRGIPVAMHPEMGVSAAEVVFTSLHAGGKFDSDSYKFSGGLHGVGSSVVTALSDWLDVEISRDGGLYGLRFEDSHTAKSCKKIRDLKPKERNGTYVRFMPSDRFLKEIVFERETLLQRFREVALLNAGIEIRFTDERLREGEDQPFQETCLFKEGMSDFVKAIAGEDGSVVPIARFEGEHEGSEVDLAFTWVSDDRPEDIRAYCNNIPQPDGGAHVTGFRAALTKCLMGYADREKLIKRSSRMSPDDLREGLGVALHVRLSDPAFSSQTKEKLISTEARTAVEAVLTPAFSKWLDTHPEEARLIIQRAQAAAEAREAAKKARELSRTKKVGNRVSSASLPDKLSDCSSKTPMARELYLVEGDSAGGSAKKGRDRETQAILPLRGKILNVERVATSKALKNAEIQAMIQVLGAGFGEKMDLTRLRYGKVVVMTDADVDGSHIATLILTFFFRQMRPFVEAGHLYIAVPPLYRVRRKGEDDIYVRTEKALTGLFLDRAIAMRALMSDGIVLEGSAVRSSLDGLLDCVALAGAAERNLRHPALADALLGSSPARGIFGTGPLSETKIKQAIKSIEKTLLETDPDGEWTFQVEGQAEGYGLRAQRHEDGLDVDYSLSRADLTSWQVRRVLEEYHTTGFAGDDIVIGGKPVYGPLSFMEALRQIGQKGAAVSRYKGLGEMNAEELWETTMDPSVRTLHQVRIGDAEAANAIFSDLMADNVSARRALIEEMCAGDETLDI